MVYADPMRPCVQGRHWHHPSNCHLEADTQTELDALAARIGLRSAWRQPPRGSHPWPHYDLTDGKRAHAVAAGAVDEKTLRETVDRWRRWRDEIRNGHRDPLS